ncbi:3-hydroxyacyl-ACP dehydratase FabZ family protein [Paenibacillus chitinolyticus]|uniref:3-hydroxyacyl-ACP dehydratase FabZ family protein n=1 Tax=Paenibacillus chitinolyticus TaxID=79263 RepID=UPI00364879C3
MKTGSSVQSTDSRERSLDRLLELLPHQEPLRLISAVTDYEAGKLLQASYSPSRFQDFCKEPLIPPSLLIEGLAQAAVLFVQMETRPLREGEFPLLGGLKAHVAVPVSWEETLHYTVRAVRILSTQAVVEGEVKLSGGTEAIRAVITVAVAGSLPGTA